MRLITLQLAGVALALMGGCAKKPVDTDLLAAVGSDEIRAAQLVQEIERQQQMGRRSLETSALLDDLITRKALLAKAVRLGIDQDPDVKRSYENLLIGKLKQGQLEPRLHQIEVTSRELAESVKSNGNRTGTLRSRLAALHFRTTPRTSEQKSEQLRSLMTEARERALRLSRDTPGFGELAIDYSEDQATRYNGGDIGWFEHAPEKYNLPQAVLDAGFALQNTGAVSEVICTTNGFYLVKLMDRSKSGVPAHAQSDASVRHTMLLQKRKQVEADFLQEARSAVPIQTYPENLARVQPPEKSLAPPRAIEILSNNRGH